MTPRGISVAPYKRRRPEIPAYRHKDDKSFCKDATPKQPLTVLGSETCSHNREVMST
jgi:hypothetical protein